jgi:hypothetical protein
MRPVLFVDLDDTLFHSRRKTAGGGAPVAFDRDGAPVSFMTGKQRALWEWLARDAEIVATTGRSAEAYRRVDLRLDGYAICSHGGLILTPAGRPEPRWWRRTATAAVSHRSGLTALGATLRDRMAEAGVDARLRVVGEGGVGLYLSLKHNHGDAGELARLAGVIADDLAAGWRLCRHDNNLAVLPPFLGKERAVAWFLTEIAGRDTFAIGVGDSLSDAPFMALCDYALTPSCSQLFSSLLAGAS